MASRSWSFPLVFLSCTSCTSCLLDRSGLGPPGGIGDGACSDATASLAVWDFMCRGDQIDVAWNFPPKPVNEPCGLGDTPPATGCIEDPNARGRVCVDLTILALDRDVDRSVAPRVLPPTGCGSREGGFRVQCIECRYPAQGSESFELTEDVSVRIASDRTHGDQQVLACDASREIKVVEQRPSIRPQAHRELFGVCRGGEVSHSVSHPIDRFASPFVRIARIINTSPHSVMVVLGSHVPGGAGASVIRTEEPVRPGGALPEIFHVHPDGVWAVQAVPGAPLGSCAGQPDGSPPGTVAPGDDDDPPVARQLQPSTLDFYFECVPCEEMSAEQCAAPCQQLTADRLSRTVDGACERDIAVGCVTNLADCAAGVTPLRSPTGECYLLPNRCVPPNFESGVDCDLDVCR